MQNTWDENLPFLLSILTPPSMRAPKLRLTCCFWEGKLSHPFVPGGIYPHWSLMMSAGIQSPWARAFKYLSSANRKVARRNNEGRNHHQFSVGDTAIYRMNLLINNAKMSVLKYY